MATNGVSVGRGLTTPDPSEAASKKAMVAAARRVVLLADRTKFQDDYLARFAELADVDTLITDNGIDSRLAADIEAAGPRVVRA
jgi:DeoR family fructose operon transcriptional repressor